ncbi:hypothetical protein GS966_11275 [Rhodococcus hoagii]|nr:hypothetical protein [Prescottella equi]
MPKYVVAFSPDLKAIGTVVEMTEREAKVGVREGRLRLADSQAEKPAAARTRPAAAESAKATE